MKARDLIAALERVDGDTEVFRSHGTFSREVIDAEITPMCMHRTGDGRGRYWGRCQVAECVDPSKQLGVLIV